MDSSKDLDWNADAVDQHMFPKLRLKHKPNLVQLSGGISSLPITNAEKRAIPLKPNEWKAKLKDAVLPNCTSGIKVCLVMLPTLTPAVSAGCPGREEWL